MLGLDHRIGYVKVGYDAGKGLFISDWGGQHSETHVVDIVLWDSHPLTLGATPVQVFIDGIPQIANPKTIPKPYSLQHAPITPNFDREAEEAIKYEGLPPLIPSEVDTTASTIVFTNISSIFSRDHEGNVVEKFTTLSVEERATVVVRDGQIVCEQFGLGLPSCASFLSSSDGEHRVVNLKGGSLQPGLVSAGSSLGLTHIPLDGSTADGGVYNPLAGSPPSIAGGDGYLARAVDGLQFASRDALYVLFPPY